jgi:type IV pilus assembly protein PilW
MTSKRVVQSGFTLVEVLIAMLIGVIGIVVMMQTFAVSEGFKRTASSGTDAQINGAVALYMLEREIRVAGYGMNGYLPAIGAAPNNTYCSTVRVWNNATGTGKDMRILPFEINPAGIPAGDANTDVIVIGFGTSDSVVAGVQADQVGGTVLGDFNVSSGKDGFRAGDLVVSVQPGTLVTDPASCVLHEMTAVSAAAGACGATIYPELKHGTTSYKSVYAACGFVTPKYNSSAGIKDAGGATVPVVKLATGGQLFNLGNPSLKAYAIRGGNLTWCDLLASDCTNVANYIVAVNDIVSLRAVYGRDTTAVQDFQVDVWDRTPLPTLADAARVMAVTLEVTARSALKEKPSVGTTCNATADATKPDKVQDWLGATVPGAGINVNPSNLPAGDWACYRHKLYQTRVPIRNMTWRP